ncbi:MAG: SDR family oxidoreductase [Acidimicrobiales bacterium]
MYQLPPQKGRYVVVTGANSGTGKEVTRRLASAGAHVVMAVRSLEKGEAARRDLTSSLPSPQLEVRQLDLADLASVNAFSQVLRSEGRAIDLLVNNAGVMTPPRRIETVDGFELQFATNFLGPFALTMGLLPLLLEQPGSRVVTMSSAAASFGSIRFHDLQSTSHYRSFRAYAQSKLADLLFAQRLATTAQQRRWDLVSCAAHPGFTRTNLFRAGTNIGRAAPRPAWPTNLLFLAAQNVTQGAEPLLYAATSPDVIPGAYYGPSRLAGLVGPTTLAGVPRSARKTGLAEELWSVAEQLTHVSLPS